MCTTGVLTCKIIFYTWKIRCNELLADSHLTILVEFEFKIFPSKNTQFPLNSQKFVIYMESYTVQEKKKNWVIKKEFICYVNMKAIEIV